MLIAVVTIVEILHGIISKYNLELSAYHRALEELKDAERRSAVELESLLQSRVRQDILGQENM